MPVLRIIEPRDPTAARRRVGAAIVLAVAAAVYWRTAYPTITWWDGSSYPLSAWTLGIAGQPGSLLTTLLAWPVAHLPIGSSPAYLTNLFAGLLAAIAATLVYYIALTLRRTGHDTPSTSQVDRATITGAALGALTFAFSDTLWEYATTLTPYVLTAVFTGLILWTMLRWWREADDPTAWRQLALLGLLFGLDFSVHRTNALLLPGALVWILVRYPRALRQWRVWLGGAGGLAAGLAVQLIVIPITAFVHSPLDFVVPNTWSRFWHYITLEDLGGGFLINLYPRKSNLWSVQTADFLRSLRANFLHWPGAAGLLGALPAVAAIVGLVVLWRRSRKLATALALVLVLQAVATVVYFNIPANFFRSFDRHYLPVWVTIAVLVAVGMSAVMDGARRLLQSRQRMAALAAIAAMLAVAPTAQLIDNWSARDASNRWFAHDYAVNALQALPPNAVYFTVGDNDTFPLMYMQSVEGVRPDVAILNTSVANLAGYEQRRHQRDPTFPISLTTEQRRALMSRPWTDTTLVVAVSGSAESLGLKAGTALPATVTFRPHPTYEKMMASEVTIFDIVRTNHWKRPLTFSITGSEGTMGWLAPYGQLEGLYWRIVPIAGAKPDLERIRSHLFTDASYRGFADPTVRIDDVSRTMAAQTYYAAEALLEAERADGARCRADLRALFTVLPPERLKLGPPLFQDNLATTCEPAH